MKSSFIIPDKHFGLTGAFILNGSEEGTMPGPYASHGSRYGTVRR